MREGTVRRLILDWTAALGGGLLSSLIAFLAQAHLVVGLSVGALVCAMIAFLGIGFKRRRPRLVVKIKDKPHWKSSPTRLFWIVALRVEVRNRTGEPIKIQGYEFTYETPYGNAETPQFSDDDTRAVEQTASSNRYFPPLSGYAEVPAHTSVAGWYVASVIRNPVGGTPRCTITVTDEIGSRYKATIPGQEPHTY
jgi:hypothetical protein